MLQVEVPDEGHLVYPIVLDKKQLQAQGVS
jgi:hypothetical protein